MKLFTLAVAACLTLVLPVTTWSAGRSSRPFKASIHGFAAPTPTGPCQLANAETAVAQVTHLGRSTMESFEIVELCANPDGAEITGRFTMTAANGDTVSGTYDTLGHLDFAASEVTFAGQFTITGGTGRFAGASGGGAIEGSGTLLPPFDVFAQMNGRVIY